MGGVSAQQPPVPGTSASGESTDYRLSPALAARLFGVALVGIAVLILLATLLVALLDLQTVVVLPVALGALLGVAVAGALVTRRAYVIRLTPAGYRVRLVRGAGTTAARWEDVEDVVAARVAGADCVVLRLKDGRSTTVPVTVLAADRDALAHDVRARLKASRRRS